MGRRSSVTPNFEGLRLSESRSSRCSAPPDRKSLDGRRASKVSITSNSRRASFSVKSNATRKRKSVAKSTQNAKRRRGWKPTQNMHVTVVDEHNHAMLPIWRALKQNQIPKSGLKMLHFDSHPDLGCIEDDDDEMERSVLIPKIYAGRFNEDDVLDASCIATWILSLVTQGVLEEITWVAGHWCDQLQTGSYELLVGICKETGNMKVASPGNKKMSILEYWKADDSVERVENLHSIRPWRLHVFKFHKNGKLPEKSVEKLVDLFKSGEWLLDIDLDYLSCNNPHGIEFRANFGDDRYKKLAEIFDAPCDEYYAYWKRIQKITLENVYKLSKNAYLAHEDVKTTHTQLVEEADMTAKAAEKLLLEYRDICLYVFPKNVDKSKFNTEDYYENKDIIETGEMSCVPHHITEMPHILKMINSTDDLFKRIQSRPLLTTVATSRADRYLPDAQASMINTLVLRMLRQTYAPARVYRRDKPDDTAEDVEMNKIARDKANNAKSLQKLFRTKNGKRKPLSR